MVVAALLELYPRALPSPLPRRPRVVPVRGGLSADHPVRGFIESYARG